MHARKCNFKKIQMGGGNKLIVNLLKNKIKLYVNCIPIIVAKYMKGLLMFCKNLNKMSSTCLFILKMHKNQGIIAKKYFIAF